MSLLFHKIATAYQKKQPFVAYRKPNSKLVQGFFQQNTTLYFTENFTEKGFVFAPFDSKKATILIPEEVSKRIEEKVAFFTDFEDEKSTLSQSNITDHASKKTHIQLVQKAIERIDKQAFEKVVVSRKEMVKCTDLDLLTTFKKLLKNYSNAFVYLWFHPKVGLWFGASPEILLNVADNEFSTMALAGTQTYKNTQKTTWKSKELEEQQLVTNFIESQLNPIVSNLKVGDRTTIKAGNLLHLKTKISGTLENQKTGLQALIRAIHPTPAVCGLPRKITRKFIEEHENYERSYYTGFLGELNLDSSLAITTSLFVNLRCMEVHKNTANLFIGGGITKDSHPQKEWEETVAKSLVMKKVL